MRFLFPFQFLFFFSIWFAASIASNKLNMNYDFVTNLYFYTNGSKHIHTHLEE